MSGAYSEFFQGKSTKFRHFFKRSFSLEELTLSNLSNKNDFRGSGGMLHRKIFENLHTVMVILALFEQFSGKSCSYFWPLTLSASSNMMHFVSTVSIIRV